MLISQIIASTCPLVPLFSLQQALLDQCNASTGLLQPSALPDQDVPHTVPDCGCELQTSLDNANEAEKAAARDDFIERMRNWKPKNPSHRNPKISHDHNTADKIDDHLQRLGHTTWGYVIYRSTYENDAGWKLFMQRLRQEAEKSLTYYGGQDVFEMMTWTIFDDREMFDGVPTTTIRQHFKNWARDAINTEQKARKEPPTEWMGSPRYRYCIQVDEEALRSCLVTPDPDDSYRDFRCWVKLIENDWMPRRDQPRWAGRQLDLTMYEPIEGETEDSVGWVKCPMNGVMVEYYEEFIDPNGYVVAERRPPAQIGYPWVL